MRRGLAIAAAVPIAIMVMTSGCGKRDRLYEATPVLESPASSPSAAASIPVKKRAAAARSMARHEMHEAELARRILELATSAALPGDDVETDEIEQTENERLLSAELIQ